MICHGFLECTMKYPNILFRLKEDAILVVMNNRKLKNRTGGRLLSVNNNLISSHHELKL